MKSLILSLSAAVCFLVATPAKAAWDGVKFGVIDNIQAGASSSRSFLVYLSNHPTLCTNGSPEAYINENDPNYKTVVSTLMLARALRVTLTLYTTTVAGYCKIGHVIVFNQ